MSLVPVEPARPPAWIELMGPAGELAQKIHDTEFVPVRLRKRPAAVLACILSGHEAGIGPMQSLRQIFVTDDGKVGMAAELMRSLVLRDGHEIWPEEVNNTRATMAGRRRGQETPTTVTWTMDDAKKAGLTGRNNWSRYPRAMLTARATTELCRLVFADVIAGISYSLEELEDDAADTPRDLNGHGEVTAAPSETTKEVKRKAPAPRRTRAVKSTKPPGPPLPVEEEPPPPAAGTMPIDQRIAMVAREAGVDHHLVVEAVTYGTKKSAKELDGQEAAAVLAELKAIGDGRRRLVNRAGEWPLIEDTEDVTDAEVVEEHPGPPLPGEEPSDPGRWDADQWRAFLAARGARYGDVLREAHKLAREDGANPPTNLGEIHKIPGLAARLVNFIEDRTAP